MGKVTQFLVDRILRQVGDHGVVVWFDPDQSYAQVPSLINENDLVVEGFDGSVFDLRRRIEPLLAQDEPPKLVVYVPGRHDRLAEALAELVAAGALMKPGQQPPGRNTRLAVVACAALNPILPPGMVEGLVSQVEAGTLSLDELDRVAEDYTGKAIGALSLIFGSTSPEEIALCFLTADAHDKKLVEKKALPDLLALLELEYGLERREFASPAELRRMLRRYLLTVELLDALGTDVPAGLRELPVPERAGARRQCVELVRTWRKRRDLKDAYVEAADRVEEELHLQSVPLEMAGLERVHTFRILEEHLQSLVEQALHGRSEERLLDAIEQRRQGFWASAEPELMERWALDASLARVLIAADRVGRELPQAAAEPRGLADAYAKIGSDTEPWCVLDMLHRQMETRVHHFELDLLGGHQGIENLIVKARGCYVTTASRLAEKFLEALETTGFQVRGYPRQVEVFRRFVAPALSGGKTAYMLSLDGLVEGPRHELRPSIQALDLSFTAQAPPALRSTFSALVRAIDAQIAEAQIAA